ncbi:DUF2726 domain-containing protein [Shewanella sp. BF02_Schw]|uniref:DUF2726 domain-containing protein n=1 Tax=Shewanella sp. BF02_Schw TaxID=394908 RepID=UPI00177FC82C|nr:DUF2726 domain-containing protein [Shewanella sp. BF02_Schw]MBO1897586.1 DUF2726 domain-containing protein [Shewanella sp. BF02_Schw]
MEMFYSLIHKQDWGGILRLTTKTQERAKQNPLEWKGICNTLGEEFVRYAANEKPILVSKLCSKYLLMASEKYLFLTDEQQIKIEEMGLEAMKVDNFNGIPNYLKLCSKSQVALNYKWHRKGKDQVAKTVKIQNSPMLHWLTPLFKSKQGQFFYQALRDIYPTLFTYPNVALKNIFDYEQIENSLTKSQQDFYFKGVVDFVVYEPDGLQNPLYFFELDSAYHDNEKAIRNDLLKDAIFESAGIKLHRVRLNGRTLTAKHDFKLIIQNLLRPVGSS